MDFDFDPAMCCVAAGFWERHRAAVQQDTFWSDQIAAAQQKSHERLKIALKNLPLPAAFREAAKALRQIIRSDRRAGLSTEKTLGMLYSLAAAESFVSASLYIEELLEPAFNALEMLSEEDWRSMRIDYIHLGCRALPLLNKTDQKWIYQARGEPQAHTTLRALYPNVWTSAVDALIDKRVREHAERWNHRVTRDEYLALRAEVKRKLSRS